jgi:hypothetical protein
MTGARSTMARLKRAARSVALATAALLLALAVIAGLARPAGRYFYCEAMGMLPVDPCARAAHHDDGDGASSAIGGQHADCCERITVPSTPRAAMASAREIPPPTQTAALPAPVFPGPPYPPPPARGHAVERWRSTHSPPGQARAVLMVFLT